MEEGWFEGRAKDSVQPERRKRVWKMKKEELSLEGHAIKMCSCHQYSPE